MATLASRATSSSAALLPAAIPTNQFVVAAHLFAVPQTCFAAPHPCCCVNGASRATGRLRLMGIDGLFDSSASSISIRQPLRELSRSLTDILLVSTSSVRARCC
ncbi:hypothetical protein OsI_10845 [Oryza sativa Indica Group]|uniref:Uncharacterized protein n=1 Tax=Oryza sativa subsp. indica TaxID=39946 RepID=B8AKC7_ORYSI|nr:hypothetical protein OsI_10845 [Oryza sativa Indica Group]